MNINDFPKAKEIILNSLIKDIKERNNKADYKLFSNDDEETINAIAEIFLESTLKDSARSLFDVFDENDIIIIINYHDNIGFSFSVEDITQSDSFISRKEAEQAAIWEAIKLLENEKNN